jgi:diguanylate cyclase (GGDEF)-like protein
VGYHWSIHQLTGYFDAVVSEQDEARAVRLAMDQAVEALGADFGALVLGERVAACVGLGRHSPPLDLLSAAPGFGMLDLPRLGRIHCASARLGANMIGHLVIGRCEEEFDGEERQLLQGMTSILGLALRSLRTLQTERTLRAEHQREAAARLALLHTVGQRQRLVESLLTIQKAISHRAPLQSVLDAVTGSAAQLLDDDFVALVLNEEALGRKRIVSSTPSKPVAVAGDELVMRAAAACTLTGTVVTSVDESGVTALAAPVHIQGTPTGSLVTVLSAASKVDLDDRRGLLAAFAEQASLALTDSQTVEAMVVAHLDSLTGLPNRTLFLDSLKRALHRAVRQQTGVTVLFIDLNRFKDINDSMGHAAGDQLLCGVAARIRASLRTEETAARLGGDEFAVLLEQTFGDEAGHVVSERILSALQQPILIDGCEIQASASIGIATSEQSEPTADAVMRNADVAMYTAKRSGARRAVGFEAGMHAETMRDLELRSDLARAIDRGELRLHYQPLMNMRTNKAVGVEALVRWQHPRLGLIPPNVFIPIAESSGGMVEIGEWVLLESCRQAMIWRTGALSDIALSVNVSTRQLDERGFADMVRGVLSTTGLPPNALTLEITESALMRDPERTMARLTPLRALGVTVAIDDFGTGYSSLAWLQRLPADQLKIDKAFVDALEVGPQGPAIVRTIVELARTLELEIVAEGIETEGQRQLLCGLGCNLGQGYLYSKPLVAAAVVPFFEAHARDAARALASAMSSVCPLAA